MSTKQQIKEAIIAYQHPDLIERLVQKLEMPKEQAEAAFLGLKQFLYIAGTMVGTFSPQSQDVDEAWHNFMLFSKDYAKFCQTNFGHFIHHQPHTKEMRLQDPGAGRHITASALMDEFGVTVSEAEGRCDACSIGECTCSGKVSKEMALVSDCISVPSGECSGTTNDD